jgi:DNA (cytosine-5)-methyltransferase 1
VLAHHYPDVPNLGDMTTLPGRILSGEVEAPDLFCGGTPCQAFSVAGLRKSLDDARGNLSLTFCEIANAIDHVRALRRAAPAIIFWENVPGVLNTADNAFGCFLGALAGENEALQPPGGKWTNAGCVYGPQRTVAWRVLDAQYFGVAQRRRRVFVVASAGEGFNPAEILFEFEGLRRDTAPSREAGQRIAPCVTNGPPFSRTGNERVECEAVVPVTFDRQSSGEYGTAPIASTISARDYKSASDLVSHPMVLMDQGGSVMNVMTDGTVGTLRRETKGHEPSVIHGMAVRRLTPIECERLQGFPDNYTNIPWRKAIEAPDGPRYKALGNSWAVPVVRWIGERINKAKEKHDAI